MHEGLFVGDEDGHAVPGFSRAQALPATGNSLRMPVTWKAGSNVSRLAGQAIRLRFHLRDCQLFAFRFGDPARKNGQ